MPKLRSPVTYSILIATIAVTAAQWLAYPPLLFEFALWPLGEPATVRTAAGLVEVGFAPWQLVTYSLLHGGFMHLFLNGFALYMFGPAIEAVLGRGRYATYWFACVIGAAAAQLAMVGADPGAAEFVPTVGASGGVFGLLLAYGLCFPRHKLMLVFPPIPMPAWSFVTLYAITELVFGVTRTLPGIAHFAHLGGMVAGLVLLFAWRVPQRLRAARR